MKKIFLFSFLIASLTARAQNKNAKQSNSTANTKIITLISPTYELGDLPHLMFKDFTTKKEQEYECDWTLPAIKEIEAKCEGKEGCPALRGQAYTATLQWKLMPVEEFDGESGGMKSTGKKVKRWVITGLEKIGANKISAGTVWNVLYPGKTNFDNEKRLIRKITENGIIKEYRTALSNTFYYKTGGIEKAIIVLFSYDFSSGEKADCHICFPKMEIATFALKGEKWTKVKFVEGWTEAQGSFGEGPTVQFQKYNNINCLATTLKVFMNGRGEYLVASYYDIETLKNIKTVSKRIGD